MSNDEAGSGLGQQERALSSAASEVNNTRRSLQQISTSLNGQVMGARNGWQGAGGQAFFQLHHAWTEKYDRITAALDRFEASLLETEKDNVATDLSAADTFRSDFSRLDRA